MFKTLFCLRQSFFQFRKNLFIAGVNFGAAGEDEPTRNQFLAGIGPNHFCFQSSRIFMIFFPTNLVLSLDEKEELSKLRKERW